MPKIYLIHLTVLLFFSCSQKENNNTTSNNNDPVNAAVVTSTEAKDTASVKPATIEEKYFDYSNTKLKENFSQSLQHHFSNTKSKDTFTLSIPKGNINRTETTLQIVAENGELILEKKFKTSQLINGYDLREITNDAQMETYIINKAKSILSTDSFEIAGKNEFLNENEKEAFEDFDAYTECKNDKRSIFILGLEEENITYMVYSAKLKKVIDILYCC